MREDDKTLSRKVDSMAKMVTKSLDSMASPAERSESFGDDGSGSFAGSFSGR